MNDSKQTPPELTPVNSFEEKCVNRCNLYPQCPCGKFDQKHGIVDKKKANGCIVQIIAILLFSIIFCALYYAFQWIAS